MAGIVYILEEADSWSKRSVTGRMCITGGRPLGNDRLLSVCEICLLQAGSSFNLKFEGKNEVKINGGRV